MSTTILEREALQAELDAHQAAIDAETFLEIMGRVFRTTAVLPAESLALLERSGIDPSFTEAGTVNNALEFIAAAKMASLNDAEKNTISTAQAAKLIGSATANIRRSIINRQIYSIGSIGKDGHRIPIWQFVSKRRLPHLAEVLSVLPADLHPLEVESFFTTPVSELQGISPVQWLDSGGSVDPVKALAIAENYQ